MGGCASDDALAGCGVLGDGWCWVEMGGWGWAAVRRMTRSRAAAFGEYAAMQGIGLCFWDVVAV